MPIGTISSGSPTVTGVTSVANLDPAILGQGSPVPVPNGLGERGYTIYLAYPTLPYSECTVNIVVASIASSPPYTIPAGWTATGSVSPTVPYTTMIDYTVNAPGTYIVQVFSTDLTTPIPTGSFTAGTSITGVTSFSVVQPEAAILGGGFDPMDGALQLIAQTAFDYHPLGTQFYPADYGATLFTVSTPYAGYTASVFLNPFQILEVTCDLQIVYNSTPADAGFNGLTFPTQDLSTLQTDVLILINTYFLSKTLPTDMVYSITELSEILQEAYPGIVALVGSGVSGSSTQFSFGQDYSPYESGLLYLRKKVGYNFVLSNNNFNFSYVDKETLEPDA